METRARYAVIGAFVLACIFAAFGFVYWLQNASGLGQTVYRIQFDQPVSGLTTGSSVLFNGIRVGAILSLKLDPQDPKRVVTTIAVDPATPIRADTLVDISFQGLTGAPAISLRGGAANAPALKAQNGRPAELKSGPEVGQNLTDSARSTLKKIDDILEQNKKPLNTAITGLSTFADMLGKNSKRIEGLIGGLEKLAGVGPKPTIAVYDLVAPTTFAPSNKPAEAQLVVPDPTSILAYDTQNILIRSAAGTYTTVENAKWADNLPKLLQARIVQSFENAHQMKSVSRPGDQLEGGFRLEVGIRNFQISLQPKPTALAEFSVRLLGDKGNVVATRIFKTSAQADSIEAPQAVAALNQAFAKIATELVTWTVGLI